EHRAARPELRAHQERAPQSEKIAGDLDGRSPRFGVQKVERPLTGELERAGDELVLSAGKMMIKRPARGTGELEDLVERGRLKAPLGEQTHRALDDFLADVARHQRRSPRSRLTMTVIII